MEMRALSARTSNEGWMCGVLGTIWRIVVGKFANQVSFRERYEKAEPILKVGRVNGCLVPIGRNETMKMLIQKHGILALNGLAIEIGPPDVSPVSSSILNRSSALANAARALSGPPRIK